MSKREKQALEACHAFQQWLTDRLHISEGEHMRDIREDAWQKHRAGRLIVVKDGNPQRVEVR